MPTEGKSMIIAQLSDFHVSTPGSRIDQRFRTADHLAAAVDHVLGLEKLPDVVIATGDLVDVGTREGYERLRDILSPLPMPVLAIPGNHDNRDNLRAIFRRGGYFADDTFLHFAIDDWPVRLIGLDTQKHGKIAGEMCGARLAWLSERLDERPETPTLIFLHHPPFRSGISAMDRHGFENGAEELGGIVAGHRQVVRVTGGHLHRPITTGWNGTVLTVSPSTAHQIALKLSDGGRAALVMEPPACLLHMWSEETGMVSHVSYIGTFETPESVAL
jgi:Icc protein